MLIFRQVKLNEDGTVSVKVTSTLTPSSLQQRKEETDSTRAM